MGLPALIQSILESPKPKANDSRVYIVDGQLQIMDQIEVSESLSEVIGKEFRNVQKKLKDVLPECVNFGLLPHVADNKHTRCSTLTLQVSMKHNSVADINVLAQMCHAAHEAILDGISMETTLKNIHADLTPFADDAKGN